MKRTVCRFFGPVFKQGLDSRLNWCGRSDLNMMDIKNTDARELTVGKFKNSIHTQKCYICIRSQIQTWANAEIIVYSGRSCNQAGRDSKYKTTSKKESKTESKCKAKN